jgi:argininosuccinate lyase
MLPSRSSGAAGSLARRPALELFVHNLTGQIGGTDPLMVQYNESIYFDRILYEEDLDGSVAFARANQNTGILTEAEFAKIESGLQAIKKEWAENKFVIIPGDDEDIHTANERRLGEIIGKDTVPSPAPRR